MPSSKYMGFIIWSIIGLAIIVMGIYEFFSKKDTAFGFWSNAKTFPVKDVRRYNRALGKLWMVFGAIFILLGLPLLAEQNSPLIVISILGCLPLSIGTMAVYVLVIEKKYRKK